MRDLGVRLLIGLAVVLVAVMAVGYAFIFSGVATPPNPALGEVEVPGPGDVVATAYLNDGTPIFVVSRNGVTRVFDARAPMGTQPMPSLIAWCDALDAFETGVIARGDLDSTLGFDPDGTAFGLAVSPGLTPYEGRYEDERLVVLQPSTPVGGGRIEGPPSCPPGADRVLHEPADGEVFDPSVAVDNEPPGMVWLEATLRSIGGQALLCDAVGDAAGDCASGAATRGIDPAAIPEEGVRGLFIGWVHDGGIEGLAYARVLSEMEAR